MEYLFDANKPHFEVWLTLYDIDTELNDDATFCGFTLDGKSLAAPPYYAVLCGFYDLVEHFIAKHPQDVNAGDGGGQRPLLFASAGSRHFKDCSVHQLLLEHGAEINVQDQFGDTPLHWPRSTGC